MIRVADYPGLALRAFTAAFSAPLAELAVPDAVSRLLAGGASAPLRASDELRAAVRALLKASGFKASGRSKPASEYLARAVDSGGVRSINLAVDVGNAVSLHSGIPVSVVDLDRLSPPLAVEVAAPGQRYVFNAVGQEIDVGKLLCLLDAQGPCANAVKDAQRSKTDGQTRRTLSLLWGCEAVPGTTDAALAWYRELLAAADPGVRVELV